jgi:hypothetical protein
MPIDIWLSAQSHKGGHAITYSREFEYRAAAKYSGVTWSDFCLKDSMEQAKEVVFYRRSMALEAVQNTPDK